MGSSRGQVNGVVWFSLFLVVACGIGLGTWAGQQVGASILPILEIGEGGTRVTPPMVLQTNWGTLAVAYLVLASVTAATVVWLAWFTGRMEVQRVLRAGEGGQITILVPKSRTKDGWNRCPLMEGDLYCFRIDSNHQFSKDGCH